MLKLVLIYDTVNRDPEFQTKIIPFFFDPYRRLLCVIYFLTSPVFLDVANYRIVKYIFNFAMA